MFQFPLSSFQRATPVLSTPRLSVSTFVSGSIVGETLRGRHDRMPPKGPRSAKKQALTLAQLSAYDDILTDALVDHVCLSSLTPGHWLFRSIL